MVKHLGSENLKDESELMLCWANGVTAGSLYIRKQKIRPCWGGEGTYCRMEMGNESDLLVGSCGKGIS